MLDNRIEVRQANKERRFSKCYHDFIDCSLLTGEEKLIFIILKRFLDVKTDQGRVFPSLSTVCRLSGMTENTVRKHLKSLQDKGVVSIQRRGLTKSNLYTIKDRADMWKAQTVTDLQMAAEETTEERAIRYLQEKGYTVIKEKVPNSDNKSPNVTSESGTNSNFPMSYPTSKSQKSQVRKNAFHNFDQRSYDYDNLEKRLLERESHQG